MCEKEDRVEWDIDADVPMYTREYLKMNGVLRHDEDTLMKVAESVREGLRDILGQTADESYIVKWAGQIVTSMQNKGILFRERA